MNEACYKALNRLAKWRMVFTGRILGTRTNEDQQAKGVKDVFEKLLMLRVENTALTVLLIEKGVFSNDEFCEQIVKECDILQKQLEATFPGYRATDCGMEIYAVEIARDTTRGWPQ